MPTELYISSDDLDASGQITFDRPLHFEWMRVQSAIIPTTYYNIPESTFIWNDGSSHTYTFPAGNYSATTLAATLQAAMQNVSAQYVCAYSSTTGKMTVSHTIFLFTLTWGAFTTLRRAMGFSEDVTSSLQSHTSPYVCVLGYDYLYISSDIPLLRPHLRPLSSLASEQSMIAQIPVNVNTFSVINWENLSQDIFTHRVDVKGKNTFRFVLVSRGGVAVDLNGASWSFRLQLWGPEEGRG